jgi:hypothetical protein
VTLSLRERGARTELVLTEDQFAREQRLALHENGWTESFDRLERALAASAETSSNRPGQPARVRENQGGTS